MNRYLIVIAVFLLPSSTEMFATTNPLPSITQPLSPTSTHPGSKAVKLTVGGLGFVAGSVVQWNGQSLPTSFVSGQSLTATVRVARFQRRGIQRGSTTN